MAAFYRVFKNKWVTPPKQTKGDYSGRIVIVTGGTSGIGEEAAHKYATMGASKVIITARNPKRGARTKERLEARLKGSGSIEVWELDMMSYDSCIAFADRVSHLERVDIAVFNAGVWRSKYHQSEHGWEEDLQVNTLSNTLLAILLLPKLRETKQQYGSTPVLEFVNSGLHQGAVVGDDIRQEPNILAHFNKKEQFGEGKQYKFSKVFLMYVTQRLAEEVSSEQVIITSVCPGWVHTDLARDHAFPGIWILLSFFVFLFMKTSAQGADALLSGAVQGESAHGRFWKDDQIQPLPPSLRGDTMKQVGSRVFEEVIEALEKDVPHVRKALAAALTKK